MSLQTRLDALVAAIGADIKQLRNQAASSGGASTTIIDGGATPNELYDGIMVSAGGANVVKSANTVAHKYTVANNSTPPSAPSIGDVWTVPDVNASVASALIVPGQEFDLVEVGTVYEIQTNGTPTTYTDLPGAQIVVPPTTRPVLITANFNGSLSTGTSASGSQQTLQMRLDETISGSKLYGFALGTAIQRSTATNAVVPVPLVITRRIPPSSITRYFKIQVRQSGATIAGWGAVQIVAGGQPASGFVPPNTLMAVSL